MCDFVLMGQKILSERKLQNISQKDLAAAVGVAPSTIQRYESGTFKKAKMPVVESIANHLHINPSWLLGKSNTKELKTQISQNIQNSKNNNYTIHKIPILGTIAAGLPIYAEQHIEDYTYTDHNHGAEYFALRVKGDSMNATAIIDGSLLIVRRQEEVENGEIAVVMVNDENATVKRFKREGYMVQLIPQSYNPEHQIQFYNLKKDTIKIIGKVIECKIEF